MTDSNRELIVDLDGFKIYTNSIYQITHKPDKNAPDGYIAEGATKLPSAGIFNSVQCNYIGNTGDDGVYDTGFYKQSPCYHGKSQTEVESIVGNLKKYVVTPYESMKGKSAILSQQDPFWDGYLISIYDKRIFNTAIASDLLDLYIAVRSRHLTPKGKEGSPRYKDSQYCIVDIEKVKNISVQRANNTMDAQFEFMTLLRNEPKKLKDILVYMGVVGIDGDLQEDTAKSLFYEYLNADVDRADTFMRVLKMSDKESEKEIIPLFSLVRKLIASKQIARTVEGHYMFEGVHLGADMKSVARRLAQDPELEDTKIKLLEL